MTTKRIVWAAADGTVMVFVPDPNSRRPGETVADWLTRLAARVVPQGTTARVIDAANLPDRRFRPCWRAVAAAVAVDVALARAQVLAEVRAERDRRLRVTDADRAQLEDIGTMEQRSALATYRQALRDLPAQVQTEIAALDVPDLETYQPTWPV